MELLTIFIGFTGGFLAGGINTLAGNGSAITLSILTEVMSLPPNLANGTNRIGVLSQGLTASFSFIKNKRIDLVKSRFPLFISILGAIIGVIVAVNISNEMFKSVFRYLLIVMLFVVLINPGRWIVKAGSEKKLRKRYLIPIFLGIGFYGGFIQMGMGVFFLALTVLILRYNIIDANAMKTVITTSFTLIVIVIFHLRGLVDWSSGASIAAGQALGGYLTAEFASRDPRAEIWAYRILVLVILLALASSFGLLNLSL